MDLTYTAAEEEFRAELRTWLADNVPGEWRRPGFWASLPDDESFRPAPRLGARQGRGRVRGHPVAHRVRRPRRHARHEGDLRRGDGAGRRAAHRQRARPHLPRAHGHGDRHRRAEEGDHRADAAQRGDLVPGLLRARRRLRPRGARDAAASATATTSSSTARRSGPPTPCTATRSSPWSAPIRGSERHRGISMLLIDMHQPGVDARPLKQMSGASEFGEVFFTDARVPATEVLGEIDDGWRTAMLLLSFERGASGISQYTEFRRQYDAIVGLARSARPRTPTRCCATGSPACSPTSSACGCTRCTCSPRSSRAATWASRRR